MAIHLPISVLRQKICKLLKMLYRNLHKNYSSVTSSSGFSATLGIEETHQAADTYLKNCLLVDKEISEREEGKPFVKKEEPHLLPENCEYSSWEIARCGLYLCPIWFASEYMSNLALANTSVASTTVLSSTSGLFTLFFGVILGQDSVNITKVIAVLISMSGVAMTTMGKTWAADDKEARNHSIAGDTFGLLSAIFYGLFTVLLKKSAGAEGEKLDMQKLFGYIGLYCLLGFWWLAWPLSAVGIEPPFELPSCWPTEEIVIANGFLSNIISDYFWALSIVWTTPLVATLGMSLTIPLAMIADMAIHGRQYSAVYILGCFQVFAGFVLANLSDKFSRKKPEITT
ncbi:thiamine-repressible mitochondrial transport protein THI74 isoform X2 [Neltuma alba]|nr:thiamine-repressible mitochondrial transport protein THI74-like isoform X2 [Prosopis alba]